MRYLLGIDKNSRFINTAAIQELLQLVERTIQMIDTGCQGTYPPTTFPELGDEGVAIIFKRSIADGDLRMKVDVDILTYLRSIREAISIPHNEKEVTKFRQQLQVSLEWLLTSKSYKSYKKSRGAEREKFVEEQVKLFEVHYDAMTKIEENWASRFPTMNGK